MRKQHSDEYRKGYHDCACMLKGWILLNTDKKTVLKYIERAIRRNELTPEKRKKKASDTGIIVSDLTDLY